VYCEYDQRFSLFDRGDWFEGKIPKKWNWEFFFNNTTMEEAPLEIKNNGRSCYSMKDSETTMEEAFDETGRIGER